MIRTKEYKFGLVVHKGSEMLCVESGSSTGYAVYYPEQPNVLFGVRKSDFKEVE